MNNLKFLSKYENVKGPIVASLDIMQGGQKHTWSFIADYASVLNSLASKR